MTESVVNYTSPSARILEYNEKIKNCYEHIPKLFEGTTHETKVTTSWNKQLESHKKMRNIKPDVTIGVMRK